MQIPSRWKEESEASQAGEKKLAVELVDALNLVFGTHTGGRASHTKGLFCAGRFTPSEQAAHVSRAAHFRSGRIAITARFSMGGGNPTVSDGARVVRGLALRFHLPRGETTDLVATSLPVFPVREPRDFVEFLRARTPDPATGAHDPTRLEAFSRAHPESQRFLDLLSASRAPRSFAEATYHPVHTFGFVDRRGRQRFGRYRIVPLDGAASISDEEARALGPEYLHEELRARLARGPAAFALELQWAEDGDALDDPTLDWPQDRPAISLGRLELSGILSDADGACDRMVFDPSRLIDGITPSGDRILAVRSAVYAVSHARRTR